MCITPQKRQHEKLIIQVSDFFIERWRFPWYSMSENLMIPTLITKLKNIALNYAYKPWSASLVTQCYSI